MAEAMTGEVAVKAAYDRASIYPLWLRLMHWANVVAVVILVMSGWRIYDATHFMFGLKIPTQYTLGGWLGGAIQWHFALMWLLAGNALVYIFANVLSGRFKRQFLPVTLPGLWVDIKAFLTGKLSHADVRKYNMIQKLAYLFAMLDIVVLIVSGLSLWKPVQLSWLAWMVGGYEGARRVHFFAMSGMVAFIVVHVVMALAVPKTIKAMVWGR